MLRSRRVGWFYGLAGVGVVLVLVLAALGAVPSRFGSLWRGEPARAGAATAPVRRTDLTVNMRAGGRVDSSKRTVIECELEAMAVGVQGQALSGGGASTLLSIVPDGSEVKRGDVLAVLDASAYEEMVDAQTINVDRARVDHRQAELDLEVAGMAVDEYRDGLMLQTVQSLEGQITLARSEAKRVEDRLDWSRRMLAKGYVARSVVNNEELGAARQRAALRKGLTALSLFRRFSAPMSLKVLDSDVKGAEATLNYQTRRLQRNQERLALLRKQVERCTIRAPHDGFVIHANEKMRAVQIEPGISVRQKQRLIYLPDLTRMEVAAQLHESVAAAVRPGMRSRVRIEAMGGRELEGHVTAVSQLPTPTNIFSDVRYFIATVQLDTLPRGLRPGMSAEVSIETLHRPDVLTVPAEALASRDGRDVCYVARDDRVECRPVRIGQVTPDQLEVTGGLAEGEEVVLDPGQVFNPGAADAGEGEGGTAGPTETVAPRESPVAAD